MNHNKIWGSHRLQGEATGEGSCKSAKRHFLLGSKKAAVWSLLLAVLCLSVSCDIFYSGKNGGRSTNYGSLNDPNTQEGARAYGSQASGSPLHTNKTLAYSLELSNQVGTLNGVRHAIVMLTEDNAYAAILIDKSASGTLGPGARSETNNAGTSWGTYDPFTLNQEVDPWILATGINNYQTVRYPKDIAPAFKQKIAVTIRRTNPFVKNVYISANRYFINLFNHYAQESWRARSLQPYVAEFNAIATDHFSLPEGLMER